MSYQEAGRNLPTGTYASLEKLGEVGINAITPASTTDSLKSNPPVVIHKLVPQQGSPSIEVIIVRPSFPGFETTSVCIEPDDSVTQVNSFNWTGTGIQSVNHQPDLKGALNDAQEIVSRQTQRK